MLATLLIIRQFLQNVKEVLQPYLYERHKLGELTLRAVWDLLLSVLLKYARLAAGKAQVSPTDQAMPGPGLRGTRPGVGQPERRSVSSFKLSFIEYAANVHMHSRFESINIWMSDIICLCNFKPTFRETDTVSYNQVDEQWNLCNYSCHLRHHSEYQSLQTDIPGICLCTARWSDTE